MDIESVITSDDGRTRIGVVPDHGADKPDWDMGPAVYRVEFRSGYRAESMSSETVDGYAEAVAHFGRDDEKVERYLRMFRDVVSVDYGDTRDARYVALVTRAMAREWGHNDATPEEELRTLASVADWVAWAEGNVYAWVIQESVTWTTDADYDDRDEWETVESVGGIYGDEWAIMACREEWRGRPECGATVWVCWHGGANYSPTPATDAVEVDGVPGARALADGYYRNVDGSTPCVGDDSEVWVYFADPREASDPYPDRIVKRDASGAWFAEVC